MIEFNEKPLKATLKKGTESASFFVRSFNRSMVQGTDDTNWPKYVEFHILTSETDIDKVKEYFDEWADVDTIEISLRKYQDKDFVYNSIMTIPGPFEFVKILSTLDGHTAQESDILYLITYKSK